MRSSSFVRDSCQPVVNLLIITFVNLNVPDHLLDGGIGILGFQYYSRMMRLKDAVNLVCKALTDRIDPAKIKHHDTVLTQPGNKTAGFRAGYILTLE